MRTSRFTMYTAAVTLFLCLAAASQDKPNALPWPAPEMWPTVEIDDYGWGDMKQSRAFLGTAKTFYLQSTLPPESATPPRWLSSRYAPAPSDKADLLLFVRTQSQTLTRTSFDPRFGTPRRVDAHEGTVYQVVATNQQGDLVFAVAATSVNEMWKHMDGSIAAQLQRVHREEDKQRRDAAKTK